MRFVTEEQAEREIVSAMNIHWTRVNLKIEGRNATHEELKRNYCHFNVIVFRFIVHEEKTK
jgi:hypothetical protein